MDRNSSADIEQRWREEQPVHLHGHRPPSSMRGIKIFVVLTLVLATIGLIAGIVSFLGPTPHPHFLPLWITSYHARQLPSLPMAERDLASLQAGRYFANTVGHAIAKQEGQQLLEDLANLKNLGGEQGLVVYVRAHALRDAEGDVNLLPGDASPDDPRTWVKLKEVLKALRDNPGRKKFLVLDIMSPLASPRLGVLYHDVASAIPTELAAIADPDRLVLCACAAGQAALVSEELGRSVFSYYFEEALKGHAENYAGRRPDGQVWIQELAKFVRVRVDRWAMRNRGVRQTPVLYGDGVDFPLLAFDRSESHRQPPELRDLSYPRELADAWKLRDGWWRDGAFRLAPRPFMQAQADLLEAEKDWRGGQGDKIKENLRHFERCQTDLDRSRDAVRPVAVSLAQQAAQGQKRDEKVVKLVEDWMNNYPRYVALARPEEVGVVRAKLLEELREKIKDVSGHALEQAVFQLAVNDTKHDPATLRLLEQVAHRPTQPTPQTVEIQLLSQLADLAGRTEPQAWSGTLAGKVLEVAQKGERATADARVFAWVWPWLDHAAQLRHEAEVRLWARGYVAPEEIERTLKNAAQSYDDTLQQHAKVQHAQKTLDEALAILPFYPHHLEAGSNLQRMWEHAGQQTRSLAEHLRNLPARNQTDDAQQRIAYVFRLGTTIEAMAKNARKLRESLEALGKPFASEQVQRLVRQSKQPQANGALVSSMTALLAGPDLNAADRALVSDARHALARRLLEETLQMDRDDVAAAANPVMEPDEDLVRVQEQARARDRGRAALALLELGGLAPVVLAPLQEAVDKAAREPSLANWGKASALVREEWSQQLPARYRQMESPMQRAQLTWIFPGLDSYRVVDEVEVAAVNQVRRQQVREMWTWLADHYRYRARDYQGLGLDTPGLSAAQRFFAAAAQANQNLVQLEPEAYVSLRPEAALAPLTPERPSVRFNLVVKRSMPADYPNSVDLAFKRPDGAWLDVTPASTRVPGVSDPRSNSYVPVEVLLRAGGQRTAFPRPDGVLAQANLNGRTFHRVVPVTVDGLSQELQILVSASPKEPEPQIFDLRLRPGKIRQPYYLHVRNLSTKPRKVMVEVTSQAGPIASGTLTVGPQETQPVRLEDRSPVPTKDTLAEVQGPLEIRLRDADQPGPTLLVSKLPLSISSPREYVAVTDIRFDPATSDGKNRLTVKLHALTPMPGPSIAADLVLPPRRIPGLLSIEGGTFHGEITNKIPLLPLSLFAEKITLAPASDGDGVVHVNVDGVERSFIFRTFLGRAAQPSVPRGDGRPAVRIVAAPFAVSSPTFAVPIETDNIRSGATLEVSLGRVSDDLFEPDAVRRFADARQRTIGVAAQKGALVFEASIRDWQAEFDTTHILGKRVIRARVLDESGHEMLMAEQPIVIAASAPNVVRFVDPPARVRQGTLVSLQAQGADNEAGVDKVTFFLGRPIDGKIPPSATVIPGTPLDVRRTTWRAQVRLPDGAKGPTPVTVQFVNRAGLATFETTTIETTDTEPDVNSMGRIRGAVLEGPRAQPGLVVILRDAGGVEKARVKSQADGTFVFDNLKPGRYSLFVVKPDSQRQATMGVLVEPNKTAPANLNLSL